MIYFILKIFIMVKIFKKNNTNLSIFIFYNKSTCNLIYINNFFIIHKDLNIINSLKNKLFKYFNITNLGLVFHYLGMFIA